MEGTNVFITAFAIVIIAVSGCITYYNVVESNNSKEIVSRAIERGIDPVQASCASKLSTNSKDVRNTCEKMAIIKGK